MMTSQEKTDNAELIAEAKKLGIKGPHMCSPSVLEQKVEDAKMETVEAVEEVVQETVQAEPKRKIAPSMVVKGVNEDSRTKLISELEAQDPDCKYMFQAASVTDEQLLAKGLERTGKRLKNDIVVRTRKDSFVEYQKAKNEGQRKMMDSIDSVGTKIKSLNAQAKDPVEMDK